MKWNKITALLLTAVVSCTTVSVFHNTKASAFSFGAKTQQSIEEEALELVDQLVRYAGTDYEAFAELYVDTSDEIIRSDFDADWSAITQKDQHFVTVVCSNGPYYYIDYTAAICAGWYPDHHTQTSDYGMILKEENGELKFSYNDESSEMVNEVFMDIYPEEMIAAYEQGRNATEFETYMHWNCNSQNVIAGDLAAKLKYMWQDEENNLHVVLLYTNGTGMNRAIYNTHVTVTDDALGTVLDEYVDDYTIMNGTNTLREYVFASDQYLSGDQEWSTMQSHVNYSSM